MRQESSYVLSGIAIGTGSIVLKGYAIQPCLLKSRGVTLKILKKNHTPYKIRHS